MKLTIEQRVDFEEKAKALIEWLNNNCHPMCKIEITPDSAEVLEGQMAIKTDQFIKD